MFIAAASYFSLRDPSFRYPPGLVDAMRLDFSAVCREKTGGTSEGLAVLPVRQVVGRNAQQTRWVNFV